MAHTRQYGNRTLTLSIFCLMCLIKENSEREGFEPSVPFRVHTTSNRTPSAARSSLQKNNTRSRGDSNPRNPCELNGFRNHLLQPLGHRSTLVDPLRAVSLYTGRAENVKGARLETYGAKPGNPKVFRFGPYYMMA